MTQPYCPCLIPPAQKMQVRRFDSCPRPPLAPPRRRRWHGTSWRGGLCQTVRRERGEEREREGKKKGEPKQDEPTLALGGGRQTHCVGSNYRADGGPGGSSPTTPQPYGDSREVRKESQRDKSGKGGLLSPRQNLTSTLSSPALPLRLRQHQGQAGGDGSSARCGNKTRFWDMWKQGVHNSGSQNC